MARPVHKAVVALLAVAGAALTARAILSFRGLLGDRAPAPRFDGAVFAIGLAAVVAAVALGVATRPRPLSMPDRRRVLGWIALSMVALANLAPEGHPVLRLVWFSLTAVAWAVWAWLGPRVKPRDPAATRWFQLLAALLAVLAVAPWLALAWLYAS